MQNKIITILWFILKILVFLSFLFTATIMFKLRDYNTAILITFAASLYLIFNKIDKMDKRIIDLEKESIFKKI